MNSNYEKLADELSVKFSDEDLYLMESLSIFLRYIVDECINKRMIYDVVKNDSEDEIKRYLLGRAYCFFEVAFLEKRRKKEKMEADEDSKNILLGIHAEQAYTDFMHKTFYRNFKDEGFED